MSDSAYDLDAIVKHWFYNAEELANSDMCGCCYCLRIYEANRIITVIEERSGGKTAICNYCWVDAMIGSASGYPITEDFLRQVRYRWLGR